MFKTIMIPVDVAMREDAAALLKAARELAAPWGATCHVVTVVPNVGMAIVGSYMDDGFEARGKAEATRALKQVCADAGIEAEQHVVTGTVYDQVITHAKSLGADLIVIGAHQPELKIST